MTELQFLLDLLFSHKLPKTVQDKLRDRVKFVEGNMHQPLAPPVTRPMAMGGNHIPISPIAQAVVPRLIDPAAHGTRTPDREVVTGHGTRGPRKF